MAESTPDEDDEGKVPQGLAALSSLAIALALTAAVRQVRGPNARPRTLARRSAQGAGADTGPQADPRADTTSAASPHAAAREPGRGRAATTPTEIPPRGWWDILMRVYGEIGKDRILAVAAGVTFYGLLALFPAIGAFVSLYGLFADAATINEHLANLGSFMPGGALDIISEQVKRIEGQGDRTLGFALVSGLAISLWSANAGTKAVFDALNVAYDEEEKRNFFVLNLWSLLFTLGGVVFLGLALAAVVVIPIVLNLFGLGQITEWLIWAGRWPALLLATVSALALLYRYGPSRDRAKWHWLSVGSGFAAIGWIATSMLFSWYVSSFGSYNETYGSLGAVIGFMTWMWLSATVILVGAELNAETEHQTASDTTEGPPAPLGARGAHMADTVGAKAG